MSDYIPSEEERLDDIKMGRTRKQNNKTEDVTEDKSKTLLLTIAKLKTEIENKDADNKTLRNELNDVKDILRKKSFIAASNTEALARENIILEQGQITNIYRCFDTFLITNKDLLPVIVDPINHKVFLKEHATQAEIDSLLELHWERYQKRIKQEVQETNLLESV